MAKVLICVPMHQNVITSSTAVSISQGCSTKHIVNFQCLGLSLLAKCFNMLWISAVKKGYDYFILHHADLGATGTFQPFDGTWVDLLIHRLNEYKLAALSVASPIKSPQGYLSSGIETVAGDPFSLRRTTTRELKDLPIQLITRDDLCKLYGLDPKCCGALLINTGLLIMDIRCYGGIWREKKWPGFNIIDSIEWNTRGEPESFTIPEDWNMSAWCHKNDVPFAFTKEIQLSHCGGSVFTNADDWGAEEHDMKRQQMSIEDYRRT